MHQNISEFKSHHKPHFTQGTKLNPNNRANGACFLCGRTNHQARQCRASIANKERYKSSQNNDRNPKRNVRLITCGYCKKPVHSLEECRKRKYVIERREKEKQGQTHNSTQNQSSGNEQATGASGSRPVSQIKTATQSLQGLSNSKPN